MAESTKNQQKAAALFAQEWQGKGYEKGDTQRFWLELLQKVLGVEDPYSFISFEDEVMVDKTNFMDGYIASTKVLIEQKSIQKDLGTPIVQSNGEKITPFLQARKYIAGLPLSKHPRWVVTCNFREFWVYDTERPNDEPQKILLANLEKEYYRLQFLVDEKNDHLKREEDLSLEAGKLVGAIYDLLAEQYIDKTAPATLHSLNVLCVRLVFCLYAEDAGLFSSKTAFHYYLAQFPAPQVRRALIDLFAVLDTPDDQRDPYLDDALKAFPYVNGGLFSNDLRLEIPQFTEELQTLILSKASDHFDWSDISPTIFGAVFESTLNPDTRRSGGMHYTSIANIHKVIDPLFLNELKDEFAVIKAIPNEKQQRQKLDAFQNKLASLTFLDPACGSGNFLTESYVSLRRLENEVIALREKGQAILGDFANPIKVDIHQFYGIEINDFAVSVATTALWIAEQQMMQETEKIASFHIDALPLKAYHNIYEGNALRTDWSEVIAPERLNYIMGNPPFVGQKLQSEEQKNDLAFVFGEKYKGLKMLDYVTGWYVKSAQLMQVNHAIYAALVSTNSICQGEAIQDLWDSLFKRGVHIDFAYRTFRWDSEADIKAHVHCIIVGFAMDSSKKNKMIFLSDNQAVPATNINGYLIDAPSITVTRNGKQICGAPDMTKGAQLIDGGGFMLNSEEEKEEFIRKYPEAEPYIYRYYNAQDFLSNAPAKYCLYLKHCSPQLMKSCRGIYERIQTVYEYRANSSAKSTQVLKDTPSQFFQSQVPEHQCIVIPVVSSERRRYIPMCFMPTGNVYTNALFYIDDANMYLFGILTSNVHMAWMRVVCGRLKSDYRYSNDIVYNNFPIPTVTDEQKARIEQTAQAILDARAKYPDCSLADLYDEVTMPPELRRAHQENDRAVMAAYGFSTKMTESECVAELFKLYQSLTK